MKRFLSGIWTNNVTITDAPLNPTDGANKAYVDEKIDRKYMKKLIDEVSPTIMYVGEAQPGSDEAAAAWSIKRVEFIDEDIEVKWANSVNTYSNVWNDRLTYTYN